MLKHSFALGVLVLPFAFFSILAQPSPPDPGTAIVSGVIRLKGEASPGVTVQLSDQRSHSRNRYLTRTHEDGRFRIMRVAAGKYWIRAYAPGYILPGNDGAGINGRSLDIAEGAKIEDLAFEIRRGGVITGRITDSKGNPAPDEEVNIYSYDEYGKLYDITSAGSGVYPGQADDQGVYRIHNLHKGRYLISVGYENDLGALAIRPFYPRIFYPNATSESKATVIEVTEGSETTGIDITIPDPRPHSTRRAQTGETTVRLVTEDGVGLPNVEVYMIPVAEDGRSISGGGILDITDENGNFFKFLGEAPRTEPSYYLIRVSHAKGYAPKSPVNQRIGNSITITMIKAGAITGRITNAEGEPVVGVSVGLLMARNAEGKPMQGSVGGAGRVTDDRGVYRLWGLTPGTYVVFTIDNIAGPFARNDTFTETYHSSSTRETATEVNVMSGGESSGIDIRSREERARIR
jgi:protocatechuate 3,4-dioxygenase beta subunit